MRWAGGAKSSVSAGQNSMHWPTLFESEFAVATCHRLFTRRHGKLPWGSVLRPHESSLSRKSSTVCCTAAALALESSPLGLSLLSMIVMLVPSVCSCVVRLICAAITAGAEMTAYSG